METSRHELKICLQLGVFHVNLVSKVTLNLLWINSFERCILLLRKIISLNKPLGSDISIVRCDFILKAI